MYFATMLCVYIFQYCFKTCISKFRFISYKTNTSDQSTSNCIQSASNSPHYECSMLFPVYTAKVCTQSSSTDDIAIASNATANIQHITTMKPDLKTSADSPFCANNSIIMLQTLHPSPSYQKVSSQCLENKATSNNTKRTLAQ